MEYLNKYQANDICNYCNKFNKSCSGKMWTQNEVYVNQYCPEFENRKYCYEPTEYHIKKYTEYTNKKN